MTAPTITALDCGWLRTQERSLLSGGSTDVIEIPVPAWLVRHSAGVVVFDAGLHAALADSRDSLGALAKIFEPVLDREGTVARRLEQHDVDPLGSFTVVISHGHFDHVGGLGELPNARLVVNADEWAFVLSAGREGGFDSALVDLGHEVTPVRGEHDVFGDGTITCIPTPGHTCGHQSLRVLTREGPVILTADACYFNHTLDDGVLPPFGFDLELQRASLDRLRHERATGARVVPGHDADVFTELRTQPPL